MNDPSEGSTENTGMGRLARRVEAAATWNDIVLPVAVSARLKEAAVHISQRQAIFDEFGFTPSEGFGVLFTGPSGTGKTLAAEVLARESGLELYRIDISRVLSSFIGETEKNLARVFDEAENSNSILLFDEADALFGKRTEVRDSHDRHANVLTGYLLQRLEELRGIVILTSSLREAIDPAFIRRLRFIIDLPFPGADERAQIWRGAFRSIIPADDPDIEKLSGFELTGGDIRNIAFNAAAAMVSRKDERITMPVVMDEVRKELDKLGRAG
jgi:SpoVK/Ycf46/Vps4 family AAA+-type ATPase